MSIQGYKKIRKVGMGAFGTAFLYHKVSSDILVVIKEINMSELKETEKQMALNEVRILSSLCHPHIIQYMGSFEVDGVLMIEMEYADGGTLAQLISQSSYLREPVVLSLFKQCVAAIEYMHKNNILHRDLKTANVFLTKDKLIKVGDFGISKILTTKGQAQTILGTPYYISPEMCEGKQYDTKSDVWALGCILYEMVCLQKAFRGENLSALVNNIMKVNFEPVPCIYSEGLQKLVTNLLQKGPALRPTATEIITQVKLLLFENKTVVLQKNIRSVLYQVLGNSFSFSCTPILLPPTIEVMKIAVSNSHFITVSRNKMVHTWGEGIRGQLGHGEGITRLQHPTLVQSLIDKQIVEVGAGDDFSMFLSDSGILMTCGDGTFGFVGQGDFKHNSTPQVIEKLINEKVKQVACGVHHCAVLTQNGALFTWGQGDFGQLGTGIEHNCCEPVRIVLKLGDVIKSVHCGPDCTAVITKTGSVHVCGCNRHNKLGLIHSRVPICHKILTLEKILKFQKVSAIKTWTVVDISLGNNHSAALTDCGQVITMGSNAEAQLGHSSISPTIVVGMDDKIAKSVICGLTYTMITTIQNVLYFWGTRYFKEETNRSLIPLVHREVAEWPREILALYVSPAQFSQGEILTIKSTCSFWDEILVLVETTVPLVVPKINENQKNKSDCNAVMSAPKWISAELSLAKQSQD